MRVSSGPAAALLLALTATLGGAGCSEKSPSELRAQADAEADRERHFNDGRVAFGKYCALCHGADATGYAADHAPSLVSTTFLESASDEFITRGIREGRPNTAMASYAKARGGPLDDADIADIITFLRDRGPLRVPLPSAQPLGDASQGERVYTANCKRCHGTRTDRGDAVHLANTTFLQAASDAFLRYAVVHGRPPTPMPSFALTLRDDQIDNVVAYLRSFAAPVETPRTQREPPPMTNPIINPKGPSPDFTPRDNRFVPIEEVKKALEQKKRMVIIDARAVPDWYSMHIPGSISVPYYSFARLDDLPKDGTWILAYCACPHHASGAVVDELRKRGFPKTAILDEGILEWKKRNYPTETEQPPP